jgi:hemerythrin-like domain-containing protein
MSPRQPLVQAFINIHTALRNDLKKLDATVQRKGRMSNLEATRLLNWFNFYWEYLEDHHQGEDNHFYPLIAKFDPSFLPRMDQLTAEHHELNELAAKIKATFTRLPLLPAGAEREATNRQAVELVAAINTSLVNHLAIEETILFASIEAHIPVAEQTAIDKAYVKRKSFKQMALFIPWYMDNLNEEQQEALKSNAPWVMKFLYYNFWLKKYNKLTASFQV